MKYLFSVETLEETFKRELYSVEGDNENDAKRHFAEKFLPLIYTADFDRLKDKLADMDIIVNSLGSIDDIEEL